jgi:hypothetical protein
MDRNISGPERANFWREAIKKSLLCVNESQLELISWLSSNTIKNGWTEYLLSSKPKFMRQTFCVPQPLLSVFHNICRLKHCLIGEMHILLCPWESVGVHFLVFSFQLRRVGEEVC